jgi:predicted transposase/invertase (TIGR01784 family)
MATKTTTSVRTRNVLSFDYALKRLLRQKANFDILNGFLSELLGYSVRVKEILESESQQERPDIKQTRVDMLVKSDKGELMIIEVQYQYEIDYLLRILFGVSRHLADHVFKGNTYETVIKVYSISIIYFIELSNGSEYIYHGKNDFKGMHTGEVLHLTEKQRHLFGKKEAGDLFPEYYLMDVTKFNDVATNTLDEWIYYLKNNKVSDNFTAQGLDKVRDMLEYDALSDAEKRAYDKAEDIKRGWDSAIWTAKDEGIAEGEAKGKKETAIAIAVSLLKKGIPSKEVAELTGLSETEICRLIKT